MANIAAKLYNFYRRYKWRAADFQGWQSGMIDYARGLQEGTFGAAVLKGFAPSLSGGLGIDVSSGLACGPTGNFLGTDAVISINLTAPSADQERDLVVVRPLLTSADFITSPTDPSLSVPLTQIQGAEIVLLRGASAAIPSYPAKAANDTVLFGVRVKAGQSTLLSSDLDFEVRDIPGKNSNFQQDFGKYDDRLRCYLAGAPIVGIKPSQLEPPLARVFSYISRRSPSIYPKSGGVYNPADSFVNMKTGAISGGDATSSAFTPTIPTAGNAIVATLSITTADLLVCAYGTQGTKQECFDGIKNQLSLGAGSVAFSANSKPIAFLIVYSADGTNVTEVDLFDARSLGGVGDNDAGQTAALSTILVTTGDTTSGSKLISNIPSTANIRLGMKVTGTGIPANAYVNVIVGGTSISINENATATNVGTALTFGHTIALGTTVQTQLDQIDGSLNRAERDSRQLFNSLAPFEPATQTGTFAAGSAIVTGLTSTTNMRAGQVLSSAGTGVPSGTYIRRKISGTSIEMSRVSPLTGTDTVTFGPGPATAATVGSTINDLQTYVLAWQDQVVTLTNADSPYAVDASSLLGQTGITYVCDTSGGTIRIDLPAKADVPEGFRIRVMSGSDVLANPITIKHPTGSNINDAASDFVIKSLFSGCELFWSRDNNSWYVAYLPRHFLANDNAGSGKAAYGFQADPTTGVFRGTNNRTAIMHGGVEVLNVSDQGLATADDLTGTPLKWKVFAGTLATNVNQDFVIPGVVLGCTGWDATNTRAVNNQNWKNIASEDGLQWVSSGSTDTVTLRNSYTSGTHNLDYKVIVFYT